MYYIQIGRLEIFTNNKWMIGKYYGNCKCHIFDLGFFGFTWLSKECSLNEKED